MSFDYAGLSVDAASLLAEFGGPTTLRRVTSGTYDPQTGSAPNTITTQAVTVVVLDFDAKFIDGTSVLAGDKKVLMAVTGVVAPNAGDELRWLGKWLAIVAVKPLAPAGVAVLYTLQARG